MEDINIATLDTCIRVIDNICDNAGKLDDFYAEIIRTRLGGVINNLEHVRNDYQNLKSQHDELREERDEALHAIEFKRIRLEHLEHDTRNDIDMLMNAIKEYQQEISELLELLRYQSPNAAAKWEEEHQD